MVYNKNIILGVFHMPKYKLSPEERAAEKERKENLRNLMQGLDCSDTTISRVTDKILPVV